MRRPKDRLHSAMVIGATPAGIVATNKLGELGIPVILVDPDPDLDEKLSRDEWRLPSGTSFNFAHRSGLLRIMRNPLIRVLLPADVLSLRHSPQGFRAHIKQPQTYIDPQRCVLCNRCKEVCPVICQDGEKPIRSNGRRTLPGRPIIDKRNQPLCQSNCPLGVNAQAYIALAMAGRFREALEVVRRDNVLPGICGRVCTHPCEEACRRGDLDEPISIRDIKRFLADYELAHPEDVPVQGNPERPEKIAVIGSGPAGLAAAADLARHGYPVTIFEKEAEPGGLLRYGIGPHRLPRDVIDHELETIRNLGVQILTSRPVSIPDGLEELQKDHAAVVLTTGSWVDRRLGVPGEALEGIEGCLSFLSRLYRKEVKKLRGDMAVIGDGNAAFDLARALRRLGARVTIVSWFPEELIPADKEEVKAALEEGITLIDRTQVIAFSGENGRLKGLQCKPTEPGEPDEQGIPWPVIVPGSDAFDLTFERAFVAIGQKGPFQDQGMSSKLKTTAAGFLAVDEAWRTTMPDLYAAGDAVTGPSSVVEAMAAGRAVARTVNNALSHEDAAIRGPSRPTERDFQEIPGDIPSQARPTMPEMQPAARIDNFSEVALGLSGTQVHAEAERCLQCGICSECLLCVEVCGAIGAVKHEQVENVSVEQAGVVIIADPKVAPLVKGEDVIRAYGPAAAKSDVNAMMTRGFAAAANAMVLLERTSQGPKGHGVAFSSPNPELLPDVRVGVFACRCNDALGWTGGMDTYMASLSEKEDIVHAEVIPSACVPEGSAHILRTIRDKGITRVALASCVCCSLDFVCSACTDQRSRLKEALFKATGVSRSMVETCNLRGEVLSYLKEDESTALRRFTGLIDRSIRRARKLKPLPTPARTYNFATAVIGMSEAALNSAQTLAAAGLEVFMFGDPGKPLHRLPDSNIHYFENAVIKGLSGTLGNFQVFLDLDGFSQVVNVGAVILGEKSRRLIQYFPQKGLPGAFIASPSQKQGVQGIPFAFPGATSIAGLFLASPPGIQVSERKKGAAAAVQAAAVMPRGPRQNKGYTVVVDEDRCRSCGRCIKVCPYQAISFKRNGVERWSASVDEALCKGCGNCISVCPSNAADSPYRNQAYLERLLEEVLIQAR